MRLSFRLFIILTFFLTVSLYAYSEIRLPQLVSDGMVLQRDAKVNIWGWASPGEKVTVTISRPVNGWQPRQKMCSILGQPLISLR
jgi:hypothetical protein